MTTKQRQILSPLFLHNQRQFLTLAKMWNTIKISKKKQLAEAVQNYKISKIWRMEYKIKELKEDYLQAVIMHKTCLGMIEICQKLWSEAIKNEGDINWKQISDDLKVIFSD